jgi:hypothetical protein
VKNRGQERIEAFHEGIEGFHKKGTEGFHGIEGFYEGIEGFHEELRRN